jgi:iron complex outermembrane recepter protein
MGGRLITIAAVCGLQLSWAQQLGSPTGELTNLSVDELFKLQVTSVGRKAQQLSKAPAAVFVLTAEDIRRSGATSIPEALQWVPGLTVLRVDGRTWAISARGSARNYSDKMLVMIDGRSLYTPLFSGVIWDFVDVPLEDIERIEVVRGPGAVMWGPNAVNGVINIITKRARATRGAEVSVASGNELRGSVFARWGAAPSEKFAYRVWAKLDDLNPAFSSPGYYLFQTKFPYRQPMPVTDLNSQTARVGFRMDAQPSEKDGLTVEGDFYKTGRQDVLGYPILMPGKADLTNGHTGDVGGFLQARWTRTTSVDNEASLQFTFDKQQLDFPFVGGDLNNLTLDYQKRRQTSDRNEVYWGLGYQQYWDDMHTERYIGFQPSSSVYRDGYVVVRDELQLIPNRLLASAGVRLDYNSNTRFEFQPSFRLLYTPSARQSAWIAFSRAVRVPSRVDRDSSSEIGEQMVQGLPIGLTVAGSTAMRSEIERSAEIGYRLQSGQRWSVDASLFWSYYSKLAVLSIPRYPTMTLEGGLPVLHMTLPETNLGTGRSYGGETWATWQVTPKWRLIPSYSYLNEVRWKPGPAYGWFFDSFGSPHQGSIRSQHDLSRNWQFDLMARARSRDAPFNLPGVLLVDARLGWRPSRDTEFSFSVQNLTGRKVLEAYSESAFASIPLQRTFVFKFTQRF